MTTGFQQQQSHYVPMPRAAPRPQHGACGQPAEAPAEVAKPAPEPRTFR